jgi:hypothetical protein
MTSQVKVQQIPMKMLQVTAAAAVVAAIILSLSTVGMASHVYGTNESSYQYGYERGSLKSGINWNPQNDYNNNTCGLTPSYALVNGTVMPALTNTTACEDGFFVGWKNWSSNHAVDCVQNITIGDFPPMIFQTHEQNLAGARDWFMKFDVPKSKRRVG